MHKFVNANEAKTMIINFENIEETVTKNFKGGDGEAITRVFDDGEMRVLMLKLASGSSIGKHTHETNSEMMFVVSGKGKVIYDSQTMEISAGNAHYCGKGHSHEVINDGDSDLVIFAQIFSN